MSEQLPEPTTQDGDPASRVFAALADATRRQLLGLLGAEGERTATALADRMPVSRQAIVKHLAVLEEAGLVSGRRVGREVRYAVVVLVVGLAIYLMRAWRHREWPFEKKVLGLGS